MLLTGAFPRWGADFPPAIQVMTNRVKPVKQGLTPLIGLLTP